MHVLVANAKGGTGKTTTAVHLAAALAKHAPTFLIDSDTNPSALDWAARGRLPFEVYGMRDGELAMPGHTGHVVIDAPARPTDEALARMARAADLTVVPTPPSDLALRALRRVLGTLEGTRYRVLLTLIPPYPSTAGEWARGELEAGDVPTFAASIRRAAVFEHAASAGRLVHQIRGGMPGWVAYQDVAREVLTHAEA